MKLWLCLKKLCNINFFKMTTNKRLVDCIENLVQHNNSSELFSVRSFRYETSKNWTALPATKNGLDYYFAYFDDFAALNFLSEKIHNFFLENLKNLKGNFAVKIKAELELASVSKNITLAKSDLQALKIKIIDALIDTFFLQIEFLIKNAFVDSFLHNKARSGKMANFGQGFLGRFEADIDVQIEKHLVIFITETIDEFFNEKMVYSYNNIDSKKIIEYNTLVQQYLTLQVAKSLDLLNSKLYTKLISRHGNSSVEAYWPPKPLKWKKVLVDGKEIIADPDQEVDPKDDKEDDDKDRPMPEPIEIFSYFYPAQPNLPITIVTQITRVKKLVLFLKKHTQLKFNSLIDAVACDYPEAKTRFLVHYHLISYFNNTRLNVLTVNKERRWQTSLTPLFRGANWLEREIWDLFGIYFDKHPDLRRLLTDYGFMGHPLRKDFPVHGFIDVRYCEISKSLLYTPSKLMAGWKAHESTFNKALW